MSGPVAPSIRSTDGGRPYGEDFPGCSLLAPKAEGRTTVNLHARYERFQNEAVEAIRRDFTEVKNGRFLLVVPTGGGKTWTAVRSVYELFDAGVLTEADDRVLWVAHRHELIVQAADTFDAFATSAGRDSIRHRIEFVKLGGIKGAVADAVRPPSFVVIDEAHHGAAALLQVELVRLVLAHDRVDQNSHGTVGAILLAVECAAVDRG